MRVNNISNLTVLPVSLKLNTQYKFQPPIKSNGYIIDPTKYAREAKDKPIDVNEIKQLLLMMLRGDKNFIHTLIKNSNSNFIDTIA